MVSSTGTFVSCKDYDDDIDNINKELTDIKSKLSDLESKVTTGGAYVTKIESVEGGLKVSVSDGTSYNLTIAGTPAGSTVVIDKTTGEISIDGTPTGFFATTGTTPQGESTAPYVKDGFWYFYDDATKAFVKSEYKASGNAWAVQKGDSVVLHIPNEAGVMQEITLPTSSSALTALNVVTPINWISGKNIAWSKAGADVTWAGKKGNVTAGQLLIGQLGSETATVAPASYDLGAQELTLVDIDGKTAPVTVTVTATAAEGDYVTDRAASPSGKWNLAIAMTDEVTADNIATAFTKKVNGVDKNVKYALAVNGTVMTGYEYVIDTQTVNESKTNTAYNKSQIGLASKNVALGTSTLSLNAATAAQAYDSYLTFEGASKTLAEAKGITVDGMNITVPATTAAATSDLSVTVNILDITGKIAKKDVALTIAGASVSETETVAPVSIKISTVNSFSVDLGTIFTNLDANIAQNADATKTTVTTADGNFFALTSTTAANGLFNVADNDKIAFKKADGGAASIAARNATKAVITLKMDGGTGSSYVSAAKDIANIYGTFNLTLTLKDKQGNELKKVIVPVTVSKPEFDDYYTANQYAGWNEGVLSSVIDNSTNAPAFTMPTNLYTINKKADGTGMTDAQPGYTYTYKKADASEVKNVDAITFNDVVKNGFLKTTDYKVKANKEVVTVNALTGVSNAAADNTISVSKEFTMKLAPAFNKAKLVYYTNGVAGTVAAVNADGIIAALTGDGTANKPKNGLALQYGDEEIAVSTTAIPASASNDHKLGGYEVTTGSAATGAVVVEFAKSAESAGGSVNLESGNTGVKIADLNAGQGGELVVTFTDYAGIKTQATIEYKK